jgi:hypothetical protein
VLKPPAGSNANKEAKNFACDAEKGLTGMVGAVLKAPVDVTYNMARGFHNLPKSYGDRMVRRLDPITGCGSGFKAAGKVDFILTLNIENWILTETAIWSGDVGWSLWARDAAG